MGFRAAAGLLALAMMATISGCFGGGRAIVQDDPSAEAVSGASREEAETALRGIVEKHLQAEAGRGSAAGPDMVRRRPYYFREYVEYPSGAGGMEIVLRENDSRIRPLSGEVRVAKVRHSTRMHRSRGEAAEDANFFRDTGTEMLNYELRNGRWRRVGSLFVADKTEEFLNGEWVPRREEEQRVAPEAQPGWFARMISKITGRDTE
ncbi:MAG TPA: hypothetical protein PKL54_07990 [Candidatus Hydrogenedentes bacterium]|nr:hypothetical protein [Candidatus Hydrogenedentota bacterium]